MIRDAREPGGQRQLPGRGWTGAGRLLSRSGTAHLGTPQETPPPPGLWASSGWALDPGQVPPDVEVRAVSGRREGPEPAEDLRGAGTKDGAGGCRRESRPAQGAPRSL